MLSRLHDFEHWDSYGASWPLLSTTPETMADAASEALGIGTPPAVLPPSGGAPRTAASHFTMGIASDEGELEQQLVNVATSIPSFKILGHSLEALKKGASKLWEFGIKSVPDILGRDEVFVGASAIWKIEAEPVARKAVLAVRQFLISCAEIVTKNDTLAIVIDEQQDSDDRRGRKRRRSRRRRRRSETQSSSSTGASERLRRRQDDATAVIASSSFKDFGVGSFPDAKFVNKIHKNAVKIRNGVPSGRAYLSSTSIEEWVPSYVGNEKDVVERKRIRTARQTQGYLLVSQFLEHVIAFWITHGLAGSVKATSINRFVCVMLRMINEDKKGVGFAVLYFRKLVEHIKAEWVTRPVEQCQSFDEFLTNVVVTVESSVTNAMGLNKTTTVDKSPSGKSKNGVAAAGPGRQRPKVTLTPGTSSRTGKGKPSSSHVIGASQTPRTTSTPVPQRQVCIYHDPRQGKTCSSGASCTFAHIDTSIPANRAAYEAALASFKGKSVGKNKSSTQGQSRDRK